MPSGSIKTLRQVQLGKETVRGTAVAATEMVVADAELNLDYPLFRNPHPVGVLTEHAGPTALLKKDVGIAFRMDGVTYQQIAWPLSLGIDQPTTLDLNEGASAGPYSHDYDPGVAALWNPHSATLEAQYDAGTNQEAVDVEYVMARTLRFSGEQRGQILVEADLFGRQVTDAVQTSLTLPAVLDPITMAMMKYYINDTYALAAPALGAAPAGGQVSNQIIGFNLEVDCGQIPWHGLDGNTFFSEAKEVAKNFRLTIRSLQNPDPATEGTAAERVHAAAEDLRFVTLFFEGVTCRSDGATSKFTFRITLSGKHEMADFLTVGESDGLDVVEQTIIGHYDATGAKLLQFFVINDDSSEPG